MAFNSSEEFCLIGNCGIGTSGIYSIVAFCLYVLAGFIMCCTPKPEPMLCRKKEEHEKEADEEAHEEEEKKKAHASEGDDDGMVPAKTE